jgi:hypothetical protein
VFGQHGLRMELQSDDRPAPVPQGHDLPFRALGGDCGAKLNAIFKACTVDEVDQCCWPSGVEKLGSHRDLPRFFTAES